jgi:peroxiredoxin
VRVRRAAAAAFSLAVGAMWLVGAAPVPRQAPALTFSDLAGKQMQLASFKGKVVAVEFLLTRCPHCWRLAQTLTKLHRELGARGFQPLAIAFDPDLNGSEVSRFASLSGVSFPVGYATADQVDAFLGREAQQRFQVPQMAVIDRAGAIRAQSRPAREVNLENEGSLRSLIEGLLGEAAP